MRGGGDGEEEGRLCCIEKLDRIEQDFLEPLNFGIFCSTVVSFPFERL